MADAAYAPAPAAKREARADAEDKPTKGKGKKPGGESAKLYHEELVSAGKRDESWLKRGREVVQRYRDERDGKRAEKRFNILWSNTEILKAAVFQGLGNPDVRRRFPKRGQDEKNTKTAALVMERGASYSNDAYDCEVQIRACVEDMLLPGRGAAWVVYDAIVDADPETGEDRIVSQTVRDEHVYWEDFRTSAGRKWSDVWWVGRCHYYNRDDLRKFFPDHADHVPLNSQLADTTKSDSRDEDDTYKRSKVWEIWDRQKRRRVYVAEDYDTILKSDDDPYRLQHFFPCPDPLYSVSTTSTLVPVPEFCQYQDQANQLDDVSTRLSVMIDGLKRRGVYDAGVDGSDGQLGQLAFAGDNEFLPMRGFAGLMEKGGLKAVFQTEDITPTISVIEGLYKQASALVEAIYQTTGISDVMRGDNSSDQTATEVRVKGQFGALRIKLRQKLVQRFIRELVRIKTEIIAEHFSRETLVEMTGIDMPLAAEKQQAMAQLQAFQQQMQMAQQMQQQGGGQPGGPPGAPPMGHNGGPPMFQVPPPPPPEVIERLQEQAKLPTWEDISAILRSDQRRGYKVDVETDQTNAVDDAEEKQQRTEFLSTMTGLMEKTIPLAMQLPAMKPLVKESVMFLVKGFKAGRSLEETFEETFAQLEKMPAPEPPPDPEMLKIQAQKEQQTTQLQFEQQKAVQDSQLKQQEAAHDAKLREAELAHAMQLEQFKVHSQIELQERKQQSDMAMKQREFEQASLMKDKEFEATSRLKEREFEHQKDMTESEQEWQALLKDGEEGAKPRTGDGIKAPSSRPAGEKQSRFSRIVKELADVMGPQQVQQQVAAVVQPMQQALDEMRAQQQKQQRRIVRDPKTGKAVAVETFADVRKIIRDPQTGKAVAVETASGVHKIVRDPQTGKPVGIDAEARP
jgi:hypothetical protein